MKTTLILTMMLKLSLAAAAQPATILRAPALTCQDLTTHSSCDHGSFGLQMLSALHLHRVYVKVNKSLLWIDVPEDEFVAINPSGTLPATVDVSLETVFP